MSEFNIDQILGLLAKANEQGINVSFVNEELSVRFQKGSAIDKVLLEELKLNKPFLIQYFKTYAANNQKSTLPGIEKADRDLLQQIPVSYAQERLWFIDQLEGSVQYHIPSIINLKGNLNIEALSNAIRQIINRHEVLRTVIVEQDGQPWQSIQEKDGWQLNELDGAAYSEDEDGLQTYIQQLILQPFNLAKDYMIRADLLRLNELHHVLVVTLHHIAADGWSASIIVRELVELYHSFETQKTPNLTPLAIQYADFAIWQRRYLHGEVLDKKLAYWKEKLEGVSPLQLPIDFERPPIQSTKGASFSFTINKELSDQLQVLSQQNGATLFMTLLAAFKVLLHRYSGQEDICVGTPIAGRDQHEVESLIGFFINSLALRNDVNDESSFIDLLQQVKTTTLEAYDHKELPFEKVVDAIVKERNLSRSPIFQVMFVLQNLPSVPDLRLGEVAMSLGNYENNTSKFELAFFITETSNGLKCSVGYCTDLFKESTIHKLVDHFKNLLQAIIHQPLQNIASLPMITAAEQQELLFSFNDAVVSYPKDKTLVDLFEEQSASKPDNIAIVFEEEELTYRQLNEQSNQLARYLALKGVKAETLVPICMERGIGMVVGILAILKAGGAYVPVDPEYPADRIAFMLEDTAAKIIVSSVESRPFLPVPGDVEIIALDGDQALISQQPISNLGANILPENLAYIIYTSGSTGRPKGVLIEHRNVVRLFHTSNPLYDFTEKDVWSLFHSFSFDFSVWEMYGALFYGGRLVIVPKNITKDVTLFADLLIQQQVTVLNQTPSAFYVLQDHLVEKITAVPIRYVIFGGEALNLSSLKPWKEAYPESRLINMYGITETTVHVTYQEIGWQQISEGKSVIGKPIPTLTTYVLDSHQNLQPVNVAGELCIGGAGLARGYLNRPELTAEKFIKDPFSTEPGARLYRSGDLGRWLPDGSIEYLGRIDDQVKIRGYRIELGEIETTLLQSDLVSQVVVIAREDAPGNKRLVGYVVAKGLFSKDAISAYLQERLPDYMVPAIWVSLEILPLTSNGKINKKALPVPEITALLNQDFVAPRNESEEQLANIWKELLNLERVGIHDNFFELGGDSILTIQVVSRARRIGFELTPKDLFIHQTIGRLSAAIAERSATLQLGEQGVLSGFSGLLPIQQWFFEMEQPHVEYYNQSVLLGISKSVNTADLAKAFDQLMEHHDSLRFKYHQQDGKWLQEYGSRKINLVTEDLQSIAKEGLAAAITEKAALYQLNLNIHAGEITRVILMLTPESESHNRLLVVVHHLAMDGVSWRILLEDVELLLNGLALGKTEQLSPKTISMRQWYTTLQNWGLGKHVLSQAAYWRRANENYHPLPIDFDYTGLVKDKDIATQNVRLNAGLTSRLLHEVPRVYHTEINDLLLAALAATIRKWTGKDSVNIGMEGHGREEIATGMDTSRTIGWFTSLYPVSLVLQKVNDEGALIKSVKEQLRALPDKGLGYGVLKYINKEAALQGKEPWDIVFNYFGQLDNVVRESKLFSGAGESRGAGRSAEHIVGEKIAVNSSVRAGELIFSWSYSEKHFSEKTIRDLSAAYITNLEKLIAHCIEQQQNQGAIFTPSDYGLGAEIEYEELDKFLAEKVDGRPRRDLIDGLYRLSGLQEGMLFHGLYEEKIGAYMEQFACDLFNIDFEILNESWKHIIARHSILRSAFYFDAFSIPVQCAYKEVTMPIVVLDYRGMSEVEQAAAIRAFDEADKNQGFDFKLAPLMRLALFRLSDDRYRMLWTSHHILYDGWSFAILMEEFLTTYEAIYTGAEVDKKEADRYEDYIRYIERTDKEEEEKYWRNYLDGVTQNTLLPFIANTLDRNKGVGAYHETSIIFDAALATQFRSFAQRNRITLNTLIQGVWAYLLHHYTGNKNVVYGIIVSGRPDDLSGVEQRVGMYINTLPFHSVQQEDQGIMEWLQGIQSQQVNSRQYQHTPFSKVQAWSGVQGDLFDTLLTFENYPVGEVIKAKQWALRVANVDMEDHTNYPLSIVIGSGDIIQIRFSYNSALLEEVYVNEIKNHFENLLLQVLENSHKKISELNLLTTFEREQLLVTFNDTTTGFKMDKTVVDLIEAQVIKSPDATALVFNDEQFSYQQLNEKANQLAHYLIGKAVKDEMLVPICIDRSIEMMVAILAVLKAGAAYVPIDPEYPLERISYMLEDTAAAFVLTNQHNRIKLPASTAVTFIDVYSEIDAIEKCPIYNLKKDIKATQLAYIIYTSGSTGNPKGVMIEHGSLLNYLLNNSTKYIGTPDSKAGSYIHLSYTFDASITAIFMPLIFGKPVVIGAKQSVDAFEDSNLLKYAPYDFIKITPSHLELILPKFKALGNTLLTETLVIGGEALLPAQFDSFIAAGIDVNIINEYGPTEATVGCTTYAFKTIADAEKIKHGISIGKPIDNVVIYILNELNELVPVGVKGEICIGGYGVARGYLNKETLTAEKFIYDTFSAHPGKKIYKTGDVGRWLPDGTIEYFGRLDDQIKIRGYRVELGEIENVLQQCELVSQGVVLGKTDAEGSKRLVSYYVPDSAAVKSRESILQYQRVASWKELYEIEYGQTENDETVDTEFNIIGWNDSFTGSEIPALEMKEWLDDIVQVVLSQHPENVLEIGCGTGLIYYQLAGKVKKYIGCDLSRSSINQIKQQIAKGLRNYGDTELFTAPAHEVVLPQGQEVDTILLNSMVQYFPGEEYMNEVIDKSIKLLKGRGRIIVGDVRDNRLIQLFKGRLRLQKLQDGISVREFKWGIGQDIAREEELCLSPDYFYQLQTKYPEINHVEIQWKQGGYINELSLYRYTVVLYVGIEKPMVLPQWQRWNSLSKSDALFATEAQLSNTVAIKDVPNPRLWKEKILQQALQNNLFRTVGEIMHLLGKEDVETLHVNQILQQAISKGYTYKLLVNEDPLKINLLFERNISDGFVSQPTPDKLEAGSKIKTNIPLFTDICFLLQKDIRDLLHNRLPDYMVPSEFIALSQLPITNNGKVDRLFLSERVEGVVVSTLNYVPPSTETEIAIAEIWKELLHLERLGIEDDFFDLGGHSLLAMRVISAIRKKLEIELNIKDLFENPTIGLFAQYVQQQTKGLALPAIQAMERPDRLPLSFSQERLWFIDQLGGSVQYHMPAVLLFKGKFEQAAFSAALQQIVNRHEVLRTTIYDEKGQGFQRINESAGWQLTIVDGTTYQHDQQGLQHFVKQLIDQPFDLTKDYTFRATLINIGEQENLLVATFHHIASDGWSNAIMVSELVELYNALREKRPAVLPVIPVQYADYAIWQRRYLQGDVWDKKLLYWKNKLEGVAPLHLPLDYTRPLMQSTSGAYVSLDIDTALTGQLQQLCQQQGSTLFMTMLAAFNVLLYRYTGQPDICVGTPVAGRLQKEVEGLIGFFVNSIALRNEIDAQASFLEILQQVKSTALEAFSHQEVPFEKVVELVARERDMSRSPLFQVMMVLQNTPEIVDLNLGELKLSPWSSGTATFNTAKFELTFSIKETAKGLNITAEYCTDLFAEQTIQRMLGHFKELLISVVNNPGQNIGFLKMLTHSEEQQLLVDFNDSATTFPAQKSIVDLFEEQVAATPFATALVYEDEKLSYAELNERSNQLAGYLRIKGVKKDTLVAISMERSIHMMVGILGILKAGAAYVPIDADYPEERINFILEDTAAGTILTSSKAKAKFQVGGRLNIISLDEDWTEVAVQSTANVNANITAESLAYIIYTSGSTGKPKGVMVTHKNVVSLVKAVSYVDLKSSDILLSTGSSSFDATTFEYWGMLLNGGQLVLCSENSLLDSKLLKQTILRYNVNLMWFTSSWFNQLVETNIALFEKLETILVGGEKLSEFHIGKLRQTYSAIKIINGYGPTENTTFSLTYPVTETSFSYIIPIGRPLSNRAAIILDHQLQLVPIGVHGEIYLSGAGLSKGYLNNPELTAEKFVTYDVKESASTRIYKTGDIGRWLPDGNIEYLGRLDEQVKIRGYRIELGEIETVLQECNAIKQAVVQVKTNSKDNKRLVGYVVPAEDFELDFLTTYLKDRLPDYMIPSLWVKVDHFVLTSNGKINKKTLPDPEENVLLKRGHVAPRTKLEEDLVNIWKQLLQLDQVGIYDNFFELGGHSLLAMRMVSYIESSLSVSIPIKVLFQFTCISDLSKYLEIQANSQSGENITSYKVFDV
jgi:amino acid adenylation domain-containing protein/non-ribosomal peptide synthase protein (TIGR01720 family)